MPVYIFEVQSCIKIQSEGKDAEEARSKLLVNLEDFGNEMIADATVSDGQEVK